MNGLQSFEVIHPEHMITRRLGCNDIKLFTIFWNIESISHLLPRTVTIRHHLELAVSFRKKKF